LPHSTTKNISLYCKIELTKYIKAKQVTLYIFIHIFLLPTKFIVALLLLNHRIPMFGNNDMHLQTSFRVKVYKMWFFKDLKLESTIKILLSNKPRSSQRLVKIESNFVLKMS